MAKKITFKGKEIEELTHLSINEFAELLPSNLRRSLKRGFTHQEKKLMEAIQKNKKSLKTHSREIVILPVMVGKVIGVHNGKSFTDVEISMDMLGHRIGEFVMTRQRVQHNAPGIGATRGTASASVH